MLLALLASLLALLAGCTNGGATFGTYHCTAPQHPVGCATQITFSHSHINPDTNPDIAGNPVYVYSDLLVVPLTCDAACRASSGNGNPPGFIYNYVSLVQPTGGWYLEVGYITTPAGMQYFMQYTLPGINNGKYTYVNLGPAPTGNGSSTLNYQYAVVILGKLSQASFFGSPGDWIALIEPPYGQYAYLGGSIGPSTFQPDTVAYGQFIYGTSGATGQLAFFANNNILTSPYTPQHLQEYVTEDGSPPSVIRTSDHPTDAGWFIKATQSSSGGMFYVSCCQPLIG